MLAGRNFVYIHIPKCAGYFVTKVLADNNLASNVATLHSPFSKIPKDHKGKEVYASMRNR